MGTEYPLLTWPRRTVYRVRWVTGSGSGAPRYHSDIARGRRAARRLLWRAMTDHGTNVTLSEVVEARRQYVDIDVGSTDGVRLGYKHESARGSLNV